MLISRKLMQGMGTKILNTPEIYVSWAEYYEKVECLAAKVYQSGYEFNQILCLARGGLRIGDIFSRIFKKPLAILSATSYIGKGDRLRGRLTFARTITMTTPTLGDKVLLIDDLVDSGMTLGQTIVWLNEHENYDVAQIKTAVIWYKAISSIAPNFYVDYLPDNPWIHQPFEIYDHMNPEDL